MFFTFYKGVEINIWSTNENLLQHHQLATSRRPWRRSSNDPGKFILGVVKISVRFPYLNSSTALTCVGSIQSAVVALCTERNWSQWKLSAFAGIIGSAIFSPLGLYLLPF
ncbi:hypothetical protein QQP08_016463 [Theobroma cacao]|nr:hypothetical protein QQP08_016463 [Theobroma cacao]